MPRFLVFIVGMFFVQAATAQVKNIKTFYKLAEAEAEKAGQSFSVSFVQPGMDLVDPYDTLEQIILIRHGEPALNKKGWFTRKEAMQFIKDYDSVGVEPLPYQPVLLAPGEIDTVYTSTINRAKYTGKLAFGAAVHYQDDPLFREFERKIFGFPNLKMPLKFWLVTSRVLWLMGANKKDIESKKEANQRAQQAAQKLIDHATKQNKVILVAHGLLNRSLVKNLKKQGWTLVRKGGSKYLATSLLVRIRP